MHATSFETLRASPGGLTDERKAVIVRMLEGGCSRRAAANSVGLHPGTITRGVARDPQFAADVLVAEGRAERGLLETIQCAARDPRHWRAAAWILERRHAAAAKT